MVARRCRRRRSGRQARRPARRSRAHVRRYAPLRPGRRLPARWNRRRPRRRRWRRSAPTGRRSSPACRARCATPMSGRRSSTGCGRSSCRPARAPIAALRDLGNIDHRSLLPTITAPALVIAGTHDAIVPIGIAQGGRRTAPVRHVRRVRVQRPRAVPRGERSLPRRARALRRLALTPPGSMPPGSYGGVMNPSTTRARTVRPRCTNRPDREPLGAPRSRVELLPRRRQARHRAVHVDLARRRGVEDRSAVRRLLRGRRHPPRTRGRHLAGVAGDPSLDDQPHRELRRPRRGARRVRRELQRRHARRRDAVGLGHLHRSLRTAGRTVGDRPNATS